ncbi:MAG: glycerophosphodiester phosphodiesterase [Gammaproteobacteria bacterium]
MISSKKNRSAILNIAHRGARAFAPENTLAAFEKAKNLGCQMFETDVHMAKDGELIVHHDDRLTRCTDVKSKFRERSSYYVSDFTYEELQTLDAGTWYANQLQLPTHHRQYPLQILRREECDRYISADDMELYASGQIKLPTLKETLLYARSVGMMVNIELKMLPRMYPGLADSVVDLIESLAMDDSILISSFDHEQLIRVRRRSSRIATAVLTGDRLAYPGSYLKLIDADAYHPSKDNLGFSSLTGELDPSSIIDVRQSGRRINVWTCNDMHEIRQLIQAGVTGLISDFPNRVNEALSEAE